LVKIGTTNERRKILMNLSKEKRELEAKGITPTTRLLAENLGVDEQEVLDVESGMAGPDLSLDAPIAGNDDNLRYIDTLHLLEESVDDKIAHGEFRELLDVKFAEFEKTLSGRDLVILKRRLLAEEPETLQQLADLYGVSREAVRVAEKKLITKLKRYMTESFRDVLQIEFNGRELR
jgi:RNA polymerase sigma-32 factor